MKILYLSCHSILEYDEVKLLHELGHEVFSPGAYVEPDNPGDASLRPAIDDLEYRKEWLEALHKIGKTHPGQDNKDHLTKELVDMFDCVIVMHLPRWIGNNLAVFKDKPVIWRTIGQSIAPVEEEIARYKKKLDLRIIRYSPKEKNIPGYVGEDACIRFYKDPDDYGPWSGHVERVITFAQHMEKRSKACNYQLFETATRPFNRHLFGPGNEGKDWTTGKVSYETLVEEMKANRVYFYTGTHPASYTLNFIEAWMTGIPIVAIGHKYGNASYFPGHDLYEVDDLLNGGHTGFICDDIKSMQKYIQLMLDNPEYANFVSKEGRKSAIDFFGKPNIQSQWETFLNSMR